MQEYGSTHEVKHIGIQPQMVVTGYGHSGEIRFEASGHEGARFASWSSTISNAPQGSGSTYTLPISSNTPPGVYTVTGHGVHGCDHVATVVVVKVDLDVDTDRDNSVEESEDEEGEDSFTRGRGAVILANRDRDNWGEIADCADNTVNGVEDQNELSRIVIRRCGLSSMPSNLRVILRIKNDQADKIRIFSRPLYGEMEILGPSQGFVNGSYKEHVLDVLWVTGASPTWTLGAEALKYIGEDADFDGLLHVWLVYQTKNGGSWSDLCSDGVALQVAPCVLAWNGQTAEVVYDCWEIHSEVDASLSIPVRRYSSWEYNPSSRLPWLQDFAEIGNSNQSGGSRIAAIIDLKHPRGGDWPHELWDDEPLYGLIEASSGGEGGGQGGDIEVTPPHRMPMYPLGRIIVGSKVQPQVKDFLRKQKVQTDTNGDLLQIDTAWLGVGHVDETVSFIPTSASYVILVPSPRVAVDILHLIVECELGSSKIHVGTTSEDDDPDMTVEKLLILNDGVEKTTLESMVGSEDTTFYLSTALSVTEGAFLRIENEYVRAQSVLGAVITVARGQLGTAAASHANGTLIYALSSLIQENLHEFSGGSIAMYPGPQKSIDDIVAFLRSNLAPDDPSSVTVEELPVLFKRRPDLGIHLQFLPYTPNVVNCLVAEGKNLMCDPDGPKVGGVDYFRAYVSKRLSAYLTPIFIDGWSLHRMMGNVHCGSNVRRTALTTPWWDVWRD